MKNKKNKKGFTLIELIVVIAILAIIAVLAIPSFNGIKEQAAQQVADANARTVYSTAMAAQAIDTDTFTKDDVTKMLEGSGIGAANFDVLMKDNKVSGARWSGSINGASATSLYPKTAPGINLG